MFKEGYLFIFLLLMSIFPLAGQSSADCSIDIPELGTPEQIGNETILYYSTTGFSSNCNNSIIDPNWIVTGNAFIEAGADEDVVRVNASGSFQMELQYLNVESGMIPQSSNLDVASNILLNPELALACGLNILLVLDESNSISHQEEEFVRESVLSLLGPLQDVGSNLALVEFGTRAEVESFSECSIAGSPHYMPINETSINNCLQDYLENDYGTTPSGGTNWDDAFRKVLDVMNGNDLQPDIILFLTDGNPTYYIDELHFNILGGSGVQTRVSAVQHAIMQANEIKQSARIFGIGVGDAVNVQNLKMITGIEPFNGDLAGSDYLISPDFTELGASLAGLANALCGTTLSVRQSGPDCVSGDQVTIEIEVDNTGDLDATGVEVHELLPPGFEVVSESFIPDNGSVNIVGNKRTWSIDQLASGATVVWTIEGLLPEAGGAYEAIANATSDNVVSNTDDTSTIYIYQSNLVLSEEHTLASCGGASDAAIDLTIAGGNPPYDISWSNGDITEDLEGLSSGTYSVTVSDMTGCSAGLNIIINQPDQVPMSVYIESDDDWLCPGESIMLNGPAGLTDYQWYLNGAEIEGATTMSLYAVQPGSYTLFGENAAICASALSNSLLLESDFVTTTNDTIHIDLPEAESFTECLDGMLEFPVEAISNIWTVVEPSDVIYDLDEATICLELSEGVERLPSDTLVLSICDDSRCMNCDTVIVIIHQMPLDIEEPDSATSTDSTIVDTPIPEPGPEDTADQLEDCFIPNVITPNGDGYNDKFHIDCLDGASQATLRIYNRWGNEVYFTHSYSNDWNGSYRGSQLPLGTYYYIISFDRGDGFAVDKAGHVSILR
ncbi:MAG: T9SS type B sorting domain-containing protein [Gammaproteobacteria bacterium]|nr:T9SS type B sorting domain-containing protein [Gammaproteobacteria bacterium]